MITKSLLRGTMRDLIRKRILMRTSKAIKEKLWQYFLASLDKSENDPRSFCDGFRTRNVKKAGAGISAARDRPLPPLRRFVGRRCSIVGDQA
jgi:hypothetical protein